MYEKKYKNNSQKCGFSEKARKKRFMKFCGKGTAFLFRMQREGENTEKNGEETMAAHEKNDGMGKQPRKGPERPEKQ